MATTTRYWCAFLVIVIRFFSFGVSAFSMTPYQTRSIGISTNTGTSKTLPVMLKSGSIDQKNNKNRKGTTLLYNRLLESMGVYESKIPKDLKDEIYEAEANTEAAKDRGTRIAIYTILAIIGILLGSFNGFLTEVRADGTVSDLEQIGFGWVLSNPIYKFLFTTRLGGGICLLSGGASGLLAEAEFDTKRINAEKIYEELERRRDLRIKTNKNPQPRSRSRKLRMSGKEKKRIKALSEVVIEKEKKIELSTTVTASIETRTNSVNDNVIDLEMQEINKTVSTADEVQEMATSNKEDENDQSIFGKMKDFYNKADSMAASQALLLNKNLEDAGVVDKITDETGLRVVGREEAKKVVEKQTKEDDSTN